MLQSSPELASAPEPTDARHGTDPMAPAPTVLVSMCGDQLIIRPPAHLDLEMTEVLTVAAASAVASGSSVMIDLDPDTSSDDLIARRPLNAAATNCVTRDGGPVAILRAGYVRLSTRDAYWTIDLAHSRLCRSDDAVDPQFVAPRAWTQIQALWVTPTDVTALTVDGTYLSTRAAWTIGSQRA